MNLDMAIGIVIGAIVGSVVTFWWTVRQVRKQFGL